MSQPLKICYLVMTMTYRQINEEIKFYKSLLSEAKTPHERDSIRCIINKYKRIKAKKS